MAGITSNAGNIYRRWEKRRQSLDAARKKGLRNAAAAIDAAQVENLAGSNAAAPGSYAVPNRSGNLMGSHFFQVKSSSMAIVGNKAAYALAIHEGLGSSKVHGRRPFLDDAVESTDYFAIAAKPVDRVLAT